MGDIQPNTEQRQNLMERTVEHVRAYLVDHRLGPGDRLPTERRLAEMFGVSRTVVRDALKTLSGLGILEIRDRVGVFVSELGSESVAHRLLGSLHLNQAAVESLLQVRRILEVATAATAAEHCTREQRDRLQELVERNRAAVGATDEARQFKEIDNLLHMTIAEIAGNPIMLDLLRGVLRYLRVFGKFVDRVPAFVESCTDQHAAIVSAISRGDGDGAATAMGVHLDSVFGHLLSDQTLNRPSDRAITR